MLFQILLISVCLSIDALGIGVSCQLKGVNIPFVSRLMIGGMSSLVMYISLVAGDFCMACFPAVVMKMIGVCILALIGITFIKDSIYGEEAERYDFNQTKNIEWTEAVVLGLVLSADAFSAGFALSALDGGGRSVPVCVGLMQIGFLYLGAFLAGKCQSAKLLNSKVCGVCSGILLLVIAVTKALT